MSSIAELCQWLRDNSSGIYRPAAEAATELERLTAELAAAQQAMKKQAASVELFREACRINAIGFADQDLRQRAERAEAEAASVSKANAILTAEVEGLRADADRYKAALVWIVDVHAMDYDYRKVARAAIAAARQAG